MLILASPLMALIAASPLFAALSVAIDSWADAVHGCEGETLPQRRVDGSSLALIAELAFRLLEPALGGRSALAGLRLRLRF